ncbi:hypothetical protein LX92_03771 [Maribacter polysiphoniae]|uniref:Uncharacterized protein n=1 Tax=Maribacter polysiphoniae TaxID=429344 RepID=A0A316DSI9_9FLAO|nr:hypothetical protein LX92_03771 [Maribacter polysiphoniae]
MVCEIRRRFSGKVCNPTNGVFEVFEGFTFGKLVLTDFPEVFNHSLIKLLDQVIGEFNKLFVIGLAYFFVNTMKTSSIIRI